MVKVKLNLNIKGILVEIEDNEYNGEIFEFLNELSEFIISNENINQINEINSSINHSVENEISKNKYTKLTNSINDVNDKFSEQILKLSKDSRIAPAKLQLLLDFGANSIIPPILIQIEKNSRIERQRVTIMIILYVNKVLNNEDIISSHSLTPILVKSNIDPSASSKAFKGEYSKFVKIDGKIYRITPQGILEARKILKEWSENYLGE